VLRFRLQLASASREPVITMKILFQNRLMGVYPTRRVAGPVPRFVCHLLLMALVTAVLLRNANAEVPLDSLDEVQALLDQDRYTEALAKARALQAARPRDCDLKDLITQLEPLAASIPSSEKRSPEMADIPTGEDKLTAVQEKVLESTLTDALNADPDSAQQKKIYTQAFDQTTMLVKDNPRNLWLWTVRAMAAFELGKAKDGWEAGNSMRQLDAENSTDEFTVNVLVSLAKAGWLEDQEPLLAEKEQTTSSRHTDPRQKRSERGLPTKSATSKSKGTGITKPSGGDAGSLDEFRNKTRRFDDL
jgi:hypothetical protein